MSRKSTQELEKILGSTHVADIGKYLKENSESIITSENEFSVYVKQIIKENDMMLQRVFLDADIPERYGYKLLSGEKKTRQRDVILRICYAGKLSLNETQRALKIYGLPELYAKIPRDAMIMIAFNERPGSIIDVNALLMDNGMDSLRTSGVQE